MSAGSGLCLDDWFVAEVLRFEGPLTGYLRAQTRDDADMLDLRQDVYARVYEAARRERPLNVKAFLFTTARNLIIDRARRAQIISFEAIADLETLSVPIDEPDAEQIVSSRQELRALQDALELLPPRCREVVVMRKVKGLSQREVASALGIAESTVEKQVSKGVRELANILFSDASGVGDNVRKNRQAKGERKP